MESISLEREFNNIKQQVMINTISDFYFNVCYKVNKDEFENMPIREVCEVIGEVVNKQICKDINLNRIDDVYNIIYEKLYK